MTPDLLARTASMVEREAPALLAYFRRRVEHQQDAADLLSETLLVLWRRVAELPEGDEDARRWMYGIARHTLSTQRRGARRRAALAEKLRSVVAESPPPDDDVRAIREAVRALHSRDRDLIGLVHWEGFALVEAAQILGLKPGAARMRYARSRERLRRYLEDQER